jgi:hypothetical protein
MVKLTLILPSGASFPYSHTPMPEKVAHAIMQSEWPKLSYMLEPV